MNMRVVNLEQDYEIICEWWKQHNHWIVPKKALSNLGLIVTNKENKPICVSWLYIMSGCSLSQIGWTTSNPNCGLKERYNAVNYILDGLIEMSKHYDRSELIIFSNSTGLSKLIQKKNLKLNSKHDLFIGVA